MKKRIVSMLLAVLLLALCAMPALAAAPKVKKVEYDGNGVVEVEFTARNVHYKNAKVTVKDSAGKKLTVTASSANSWALKQQDGSETVGYKLATASTNTEATTSWTFDSLSSTATKKDMGIIVEDYSKWPETPELIWNGRMAPIAGYAAKGFLWYQGCSNMDQECYDKLQTSMVKLWRDAWGRGDMPFIFTLLAPYEHYDANARKRPHFIETQLRSLKTIPNSYAICTETYGDFGTIHPPKKREVADMMVFRALQNIYGQDLGFDIELPEVQSVEYLEDGRAKVTLTHVWSNLQSITARGIVGFELAGEDRVFHLAEAEVDWDGGTIYVHSDEVPKPIAVRYAFRNWMGANLEKSMGIPVPPFRTDDWDL